MKRALFLLALFLCFCVTSIFGQTKIPITVKSEDPTISDAVEFDGNLHTWPNVVTKIHLTSGSLRTGDVIQSFATDSSYFLSGTYDIGLKDIVIIDNHGDDVTDLYEITSETTQFTISPRDSKYNLQPQTKTDEREFNGSLYQLDGFEYDTYTFDGHKYRLAGLTAHAEETNAGTYPMVVSGTAQVFLDTLGMNLDVTDQFQITPIIHDLVITKKLLAITIDSTRAYDGNIFSISYSDLAASAAPALVEGDAFTAGEVQTFGSDVGDYRLNVSTSHISTPFETSKGIENYVVQYNFSQTIAPLEIDDTIKGNIYTGDYDGTTHSSSGYTHHFSSPLYDPSSVTGPAQSAVSASRMIAGKTLMEIRPAQFENTDENFNVNFVIEDGYVQINKIGPITIKTGGDTVTYFGDTLRVNTFTYTGDLLPGDDLSCEITGKIRNAGRTNNTLASYKVMHGSVDVTSCYNFSTPVLGKLMILPVKIEVTTKDSTKTYDGTPLKAPYYTITSGAFVGSDFITFDFSNTHITEPGEKLNDYEPVCDPGTLTENYEFTNNFGKLKITDSLRASGIIFAVACHGGTTTAGIYAQYGHEGQPPYEYQLDNGPWQAMTGSIGYVNGLYGGTTYTLRIRDALGVVDSVKYTPFDPPAIEIDTIYTTSADCGRSNGAASAEIAGGTAVDGTYYFYEWRNASNVLLGQAPSIGNLPIGNYTLTAKDYFGCSITKDFEIKVGRTVAVNNFESDQTCKTYGSYCVTPKDGSNGYIPAGTTFDIVDTVFIPASAEPNVTFAGGSASATNLTTICTGTVTNNSGVPLTLRLVVKPHNPDCGEGANFYVDLLLGGTDLEGDPITIHPKPLSLCGNSGNIIDTAVTVELTGLGLADSYVVRWKFGNNPIVTSSVPRNATEAKYNVQIPDTCAGVWGYRFYITDSKGCTHYEDGNYRAVPGSWDLGTLTSLEVVACADEAQAPHIVGTLDTIVTSCGDTVRYTYSSYATGTTCDMFIHHMYTYKDCRDSSAVRTYSYHVKDTVIPQTRTDYPKTVKASVQNCVFTIPTLMDSVTPAYANCNGFIFRDQTPEPGMEITEDTDVIVRTYDYCGNTKYDTIRVVVDDSIRMSAVAHDSHCYDLSDGYIEGTFSGGVPPYDIIWKSETENGAKQQDTTGLFFFNDLPDGEYKITIVGGNGCKSADTIDLLLQDFDEPLIITAKDATQVYDGTYLKQPGYTYTGTLREDTLTHKQDSLVVYISDSIIDYGTRSNRIDSVEIWRGGIDVTCEYNLITVDGTLTVTKRKITLKSADSTRAYDGTPLTNHRVTIVSGSFVLDQDTASTTVTGTRTLVGNTENDYTYTLNSNTNPNNYEIIKKYGDLKVTKAPTTINIKACDSTIVYNCDTLRQPRYTYNESALMPGDELFVTISGWQLDVGTSYNLVVDKKIMNGTTDVTSCYTVNVQNGKLQVKPRPLTLTAGGYTVQYDGEFHGTADIPDPKYTISGSGLASCDNIAALNLTGGGTIVSDHHTTYVDLTSVVIEDGNHIARTADYELTPVNGNIVITPRTDPYPLIVVAHSDSAEFTGYPQTCKGYDTLIINGDTVLRGGSNSKAFTLRNEHGHLINYTIAGIDDSISRTNAGTYPVHIAGTPRIIDDGGHDVTDQFSIELRDGTFVIKKHGAITIYVTDTKPYDATPLTTAWNHTNTSISGQVTGDYLTAGTMVTNSPAIGSYSYDSEHLTDPDKSNIGNQFTTHFGLENYADTIYVVSQTITIGESMTAVCPNDEQRIKIYDATPLRPQGSVADAPVHHPGTDTTFLYRYYDETAGAWTAWSNVIPNITHVGTLDAEVKVMHPYYKPDSCQYQLQVKPRPVTLTSASDHKEYDGSDLTAPRITVGGMGFATAGTWGAEGIHDTLVPTHIRNVVDGSVDYQTDNPFTYTLQDNTDPNDYKFDTVIGKLYITPRPVTIQSLDSMRAYNGNALQHDSARVISTKGFLGGDTVYYTNWASQTIPGYTANTYDTTNFTHGVDATSTKENYDITLEYGTLKVIESFTLTISSQHDTVMYDGTVHTGKSFRAQLNGVELERVPTTDSIAFYVFGHDNIVTVHPTAQIVNVGDTASTFDIDIWFHTIDITACYPDTVLVDTGRVYVTPRPLVITVNQTKEYDHTKLFTPYHITTNFTSVGLVATDRITAGTITTDSNAVNIYTYDNGISDGYHSTVTADVVVKNNNGSGDDITYNYNISYDVIQTITPSDDYTLTCPSGSSISKTYDGTELNPTATVSGQYAGDVLTIEYSTNGGTSWSTTQPSITHVSESISEVMVRATNPNYVTKTCSYSLTINKRNVKPTSATASKVYDHTPLTNDTVTTPTTGIYLPWVSGEEATYTVVGTQTEVGSSKNDFDFTWNANAVQNDYVVKLDTGTLTVTPTGVLEVYCPGTTNNTAAVSKTYDGSALSPTATFNSSGLYGTDAANVVVEYKVGTGTWSTTPPSITHYVDGPLTVQVRATHHDYTTATCSYTLTINKRPIEITSADSTQVYDRTENRKEVNSVTSGSFVGTESFTYSNWTGITNVGSQDNTFKFAPGTGTDTNDYNVTRVYGTLKVTPSPVATVTCPSGDDLTKMYDGDSLKPTASATGISPDVVPVQYATSATGPWQDEPIGILNVGTQHVYVRTNNANYEEKTCDYVLTDTCRHITLTSQDSTRKYTATALNAHRVTVGGDGFATGESFTYSSFAAPVDSGVYSNTFNYAAGTGTLLSNYCVATPVYGTLTITRSDDRSIDCPTTDAEKTHTYDGNLFAPTVTAEGIASSGDSFTIEYSLNGTSDWTTTALGLTDVGTQHVYVRATNNNYDTITCDYVLEVKCRPITLTSATEYRTYNGETWSKEVVTVGGDGLVSGQTIAYTNFATIKNVDTVDNTFSYSFNSPADPDNYCVTVVKGKLGVKRATLNVECPGTTENPVAVTKMYDGTKLDPAADTSGLYAGDVATLNYSVDNGATWSDTVPYITHVGTKDVKVRATHANYDTAYCDYTLEITCRSLTLTSPDSTRKYNGEALIANAITVGGDSLVDGESLTFSNHASITNVGSTSNTFDYAFDAPAQAGDYCVTPHYGTLKVTKAHLTVDCPSGADLSKVYDGDSLKPVATGSGAFSPDAVIIEYSTDENTWSTDVPGIINKGTLQVYVRATVGGNYDTATCNYALQITPVESEVVVYITGHHALYDWTGYEQEVTGYDTTCENALYRAVMDTSFSFSGSGVHDSIVRRTNIGVDSMELQAADFDNHNPNFTNVRFIVKKGWIEIKDITKPEFTYGCADIAAVIAAASTIYPNDGDKYRHSGTAWDAVATDNYLFDSLYYTLSGATTVNTTDSTTLDNQLFNIGTTYVTWLAKDAAGNDTTCTFAVVVEDNVDPTIICPKDTLVMCSSDIPLYAADYDEFIILGGSAEDHESGLDITTFIWNSDTPDGIDCHDTIRREYYIEDKAHNSSTCTQKIIVKDTVKPTFTVPADLELCRNDITGEIEADITVTGIMSDTADNCLTPAQLHAGWRDLDTTGTDATVRIIHREWYLADTCGDTTKKIQNITINPSLRTAGNLDKKCPNDTVVILDYGRCDTAILLPHPAYVNYMTGSNVVLSKDIPDDYRYGAETTTTVTWVYTDDCGATDTCLQKVTVHYPPCGTPGDSVQDADGIMYSSVRIGCYCWTGENLRSTHYSDGTPIVNYTSYNESDSLENLYGKLYSWYSAARVAENDNTAVPVDSVAPHGNYIQGICPQGWALPTMDEYLQMIADAGGQLEKVKEADQHFWYDGNAGTLPNSGFDARGGGQYNAETGAYQDLMVGAYFWTTTNTSSSTMMICSSIPNLCSPVEVISTDKRSGMSIRCIRMK